MRKSNKKLSQQIVNQIRQFLLDGKTPTEIARHLGIGLTTVRYIRDGKRRLHSPRVPACHPDKTYGARGLCSSCYKQLWAKENPERILKSQRQTEMKYGHRNNLAKNYGITLDEYNELIRSQDGLCAICGSPETNPKKKYLSVDHDHKTNLIRGLLCSRCNVLLGCADDSLEILTSAIMYLLKSSGGPDGI